MDGVNSKPEDDPEKNKKTEDSHEEGGVHFRLPMDLMGRKRNNEP